MYRLRTAAAQGSVCFQFILQLLCDCPADCSFSYIKPQVTRRSLKEQGMLRVWHPSITFNFDGSVLIDDECPLIL